MAKFILDENIPNLEESDDDIQLDNQELLNYRGDHNDSDEEEQRYYEFNAHFPYEYVYKKLENFVRTMSPERKELYENNIQDNFRRNANECTKEKLKQRVVNDRACYVLNKNINLQENVKCLEEKNLKLSQENSVSQHLQVAYPENSVIYSLMSNAKSRNINSSFKQSLATVNEKQISLTKKSNRNIQISFASKGCKRQSNSLVAGKIPARKKEESKGVECRNMYTSYTNNLISPNNNFLVNKNKNIKSKQTEDRKDNYHIYSTIIPQSVNIDKEQKMTGTVKSINQEGRTECGLSQSKSKVTSLATPPVATSSKVDANNILIKSEAAEISITTGPKDRSKNTNKNTITNILTCIKSKQGRNYNIKNLNPQNTKIMAKSNYIINIGKEVQSITGTLQKMNTTEREGSQLEMNRPQVKECKNEVNKYHPISVASKEKKGQEILNANIPKVDNPKNNMSLSLHKIQEIITNQLMDDPIKDKEIPEESKCTEGENDIIFLAESNQTTNIALVGKIFSNMNKKAEIKSRNIPINNLTQTKSNIYSEREKAHSIHSGSFHSNHLLTQAAPKSITTITVNEPSKQVVKNESLSKDPSDYNRKTFLTNKNRNIYTQKPEKTNIEGKKTWKVDCNILSLKKTLNTAHNNAFKVQHHSKITPISINKEQKITENERLKLKNKKQESNSIQINTESTNGSNSAKKHALFNTNSTLKGSSQNKNKPFQPSIFIKMDSSKLKTKSNSINSNASNGINSSGNSLGKCLIKNYNNYKNPTRISNGSYLNLKKNEFQGSNDKNVYAAKSVVSPPSNSSLEKISTCTNGTSIMMKKTPTEKSIK